MPSNEPVSLTQTSVNALALALNAGNRFFLKAGVPTTDFNGVAPIGALCFDTTDGQLYVNTGTVASNTWSEFGALPAKNSFAPTGTVNVTLTLADLFGFNEIVPVASAGAATIVLPSAASAVGFPDCRIKVIANATSTYLFSTNSSTGVQATGYWNGGTPTYSTTPKSDHYRLRSDGAAWYGIEAIVGLTAGS